MNTTTAQPVGAATGRRSSAVSAVPREARPYQGRRAGLISRVLAAAVDVAVVVAVLLGAYAGWATLLFLVNPRGFHFPDPSLILGLAAGCVVSAGYLTVAWATTGRTLGNQVMGLRVVNRRGDRVRLLSAFLRALLYIVLPIGLFWVAVSRSNRSLADVVLRTSVIYYWQPSP
jgi:uncharacterized RDD family membrane protein YckC